MSVKNFLNLSSSITSHLTSHRGLSILAALATASMPMTAHAANSWDYDAVETGTVAKDTTDINHTKITVDSTVGVVNGNADIALPDTVTVDGTGSVFVYKDNRAGIGTEILGTLNSDLKIVISDRNGVLFGADSIVDVGSIVATTGTVDNAALTGPDHLVEMSDFGTGGIEMNGMITVADAGIAAFVSPSVVNNGMIVAKMGKVSFAAGEKATLDLYGDGLVEIAPDSALASAILENTHTGTISAEGGTILMTAQTAAQSVNSLINLGGVLDASSVSMKGGDIVLDAGEKGRIVVNKHTKIKADGTDGGLVTAKAGKIGIARNAEITADTNAGGAGGSVAFDVGSNMKIVNAQISAMGTGGTIDFTVGNTLSLLGGGRIKSESVHVDVPTVNLDGDIDSPNITGTATMVNVLSSDHGAQINDGVGVAASGATVNVGAGTYNEAVVLDKAVSLLGAQAGVAGDDASRGVDETIIIPNSPGILVTADNTIVDGVTVNGGDDGVLVDGADNVTVRNSIMHNQTLNGVHIKDSLDSRVYENAIYDVSENGIKLDNSDDARVYQNEVGTLGGALNIGLNGLFVNNSDRASTWNNIFRDVTRSGVLVHDSDDVSVISSFVNDSGTGVYFENTNNARILSNHIEDINNPGNNGDGIILHTGRNVLIDSNHIDNVSDEGIFARGDVDGLRITNNRIDATGVVVVNTGSGIELFATTGAATVSGNTVENADHYGIWIKEPKAGSSFVVDDNTVINSALVGIGVDGNATSVSGNTVTDSGLTGSADGIRIEESAGVLVKGNIVSGASEDGIDVDESAGAEITSNIINHIHDDGIDLDNTTGANIHHNEIGLLGGVGNIGDDGIDLDESGDSLIEENKIRNTVENGIDVSRSDRTDIINNMINDVSGNGIKVNRSDESRLFHNKIGMLGGAMNIGRNGIVVSNSDHVSTWNNIIHDAKGAGVFVKESDHASVISSFVENAETGIRFKDSDDGRILSNDIENTDNGITLKRSDDAEIADNIIDNSGVDAIHVAMSNNAVIKDNIINHTGRNGIKLSNSDDARVYHNKIGMLGGAMNIGRNGIVVSNSDHVSTWNNIIHDAKGAGVFVKDSDHASVISSYIENAETGIRFKDSDDGRIISNDIENTENGITLKRSHDAEIANNVIDDSGVDAIHVAMSNNAFITGNIIDYTGDDGIEVVGGLGVWIAGNTITNAGAGDGFDYGGADYYGADGIHVRNVQGRVMFPEDAPTATAEVTGEDEEHFGPFGAPSDYAVVITDNDIRVTGDDGIEVVGEERDHEELCEAPNSYMESGTGRTLIAWNTIRQSGYGIVDEGEGEGYEGAEDGYGSDGIHVRGVRAGFDFRPIPVAIRATADLPETEGDDEGRFAWAPDGYGYSVEVLGNDIKHTGDDGVEVRDSGKTLIANNKIRRTGLDTYEGGDTRWEEGYEYGANDGDGIKVENVYDRGLVSFIGFADRPSFEEYGRNSVEILANDIKHTGDDGIDVHESGQTLIAGNKIRNAGYGDDKNYEGGDEGWGHDGIHVGQVYGGYPYAVRILDNNIKTTGDDGIEVHKSGRTLIAENKVRNAGYGENKSYETGDRLGADGIYVAHVYDEGNAFSAGETADEFVGYAVEIIDNKVDTSADDGIEVNGSSSVLIAHNNVKNSGFGGGTSYEGGDIFGADGIHVRNVWNDGDSRPGLYDGDEYRPYSVVIRRNRVDSSGDDGAQVLFSGDTLIKRNRISNSGSPYTVGLFGGDGISVVTGLRGFFGETQNIRSVYGPRIIPVSVEVTGNKVFDSLDDGVQVVGANKVLVKRNTITRSGDDGINVLGFASLNVETEDFETDVAFFDKEYSETPKFRARIVNNIVTESGTAPEEETVTDAPSALRSKYNFRHLGGDGIQVEGFDKILVRGNDVSNSVENGLYVSGPNNGDVRVFDNVFTDNDIGAHFESGLIDLTEEPGNIFNGGRIGLRFSPYAFGSDELPAVYFAPDERVIYSYLFPSGPMPFSGFADLALVDTDGAGGFGGTIGSQLFDGQSDFFIELDNGAFFDPGTPTILSALDSTFVTPFGDVTPSTQGNILSQDEFDFINGKIFDFRDRDDLGLFFFGIREDDVVININQEELFNTFDPFGFNGGNVQVTILGLPSTRFGGGAPTAGAAAFNNIAPAAGGTGGLTPEELNALETAAGGETTKTTCWSDATASAQSGAPTTVSFGSTLTADTIAAETACGS